MTTDDATPRKSMLGADNFTLAEVARLFRCTREHALALAKFGVITAVAHPLDEDPVFAGGSVRAQLGRMSSQPTPVLVGGAGRSFGRTRTSTRRRAAA